MWLRRQDELNEARPTERFSTAIRLLSGRASMERRYAKELQDRTADDVEPAGDGTCPPGGDQPGEDRSGGAGGEPGVDVRGYAAPAPPESSRPAPPRGAGSAATPRQPAVAAGRGGPALVPSALERGRRARVLARRRRTTVVLFLAFTVGTVAAAVGGLALLWAPAVPAALLSAYIGYLRVQERRRFAFTMDQRRAEVAAQRLRERRPGPPQAARGAADPEQDQHTNRTAQEAVTERVDPASGWDEERPTARMDAAEHSEPTRGAAARQEGHPAGEGRPGRTEHVGRGAPTRQPSDPPAHRRTAPGPPQGVSEPGPAALAADRRALVEQTDHAEWLDQQRRSAQPTGDGWEPVPVPLPTYVTAPVAPRATANVDLGAPDAWSSARSSTAEPPSGAPGDGPPREDELPDTAMAADGAATPDGRPRGRTPLFDQYEQDDRPRAVNE